MIIFAGDFILVSHSLDYLQKLLQLLVGTVPYEKKYLQAFHFSRHRSAFSWADKKMSACTFVFPSKLTVEHAFIFCTALSLPIFVFNLSCSGKFHASQIHLGLLLSKFKHIASSNNLPLQKLA